MLAYGEKIHPAIVTLSYHYIIFTQSGESGRLRPCGCCWLHKSRFVEVINITGGHPLERWEIASILPISQAGDGRWLALTDGGRREIASQP